MAMSTMKDKFGQLIGSTDQGSSSSNSSSNGKPQELLAKKL